ncbi:hypothetical protein L9F63_014523, partial [Diploptera punctata]
VLKCAALYCTVYGTNVYCGRLIQVNNGKKNANILEMFAHSCILLYSHSCKHPVFILCCCLNRCIRKSRHYERTGRIQYTVSKVCVLLKPLFLPEVTFSITKDIVCK